MKSVHPVALFRMTVLGELISRQFLPRGELKAIMTDLAQKHYTIPNSRHTQISEKTIESWYYAWKKGGVDALAPKKRMDRGQSKISDLLQEAILKAKQDNPKRSINSLLELLRMKNLEGAHALSRSSVYRLLLRHDLSRPIETTQPKEFRRFEADYPGDMVYGDVMHGPQIEVNGKVQKGYLVSLMDDKSRLILHSVFCPSEKALDIEYVLKQSLLRRGLPKRLILDNGSAYRSHSLQGICARLSIELIYCKPYAPEGKAKLERWHRTLRSQFLSELPDKKIYSMTEINQLLWAWIDEVYHPRPHSSLSGQSPLSVWQKGLEFVKPLGTLAHRLDELFYHRVKRRVRKDSTISYEGKVFDVPYELARKNITIVVEPHQQQALYIEDDEGKWIGDIVPVDLQANRRRKRAQPDKTHPALVGAADSIAELALKQQQAQLSTPHSNPNK